MVDVFKQEFSYLKVDPEFAQSINHPEHFEISKYIYNKTDSYIKFVDKGKKERNIYYNVSYDEEEKQKIREIETMAQQNNVHHTLFSSTGQILKFIYGNQQDTQKAYENMINHIKWIEDPITFNLQPQTLQNLKEGYLYIAGVDKQMRPTIVFNVDKINLDKATEDTIIPAYNRIFKIVEEYYYYKSKIENWNVIIETNELSALSIPIKIIGKIVSTMQSNFPSNLNRIIILNPSTSLNFTWNVIAAFINERSLKKISFLKKSELKKLLEFYDPDQLEQRFGGTAPNVTKYYPPEKFQPSATYAAKVSQRRVSIQRVQQNMMDAQSKYAIPKELSQQDSFTAPEYQYRSSQNPSMYQASPPLQNNQFKQDYMNMNQSPSTLSTNKYDLPTQQNYGSNSVVHKKIFTNHQRQSSNQYNSNRGSSNQLPQVGSNHDLFNQNQQLAKSSVQAYNSQQPQSARPNQSLGTSTPLRFTKTQTDQMYTVTLQPPEFRNEIQQNQQIVLNSQSQHRQQSYSYQVQQPYQPQQQQQQYNHTISKYSIVNDVIDNKQNLLEGIEDEDNRVKRSKNVKVQQNTTDGAADIYLAYQQANKFEVKDPKDPIFYMDQLKNEKYNACNIF